MFDIQPDTYNFPVETQAVYDQFGQPIPGSKAIMRTDTNEVLGVHGSRYKLLKHDDVVSSIMDAVNNANLSQDYETKFSVVDGGRKLRGEILFNDLVVEPFVGDYTKFRVSFFNSYDGSWSFSQAAEGLRLWCLNGCTSPDAIARTRFKHTNNINIEGSAAKIKTGLETFLNNKERWQQWAKVQVSDQMAEIFFKHTIAKAPSNQSLKHKSNEKQLEKLLGMWRNERSALGRNKWALYNVMTAWATHTEESKNPEVTRYNREDSIAKAMRSDRWNNLELEGVF